MRTPASGFGLQASGTTRGPPTAGFTLRWRREFLFLRLFMAGSLLIPRSIHRLLGRGFVFAIEKLLRGTAAAIRGNLARILVMPRDAAPSRVEREIARRTRRALLNYGSYLFDHAWFTLGPPERLGELFREVSGAERLEAALARGKGVVLATGHMGFWDLGAAALAERGHRISVVALAGGDPRTNLYRDRGRARRAIEILWTGAEEASAFSLVAALRALREGRIVALLADRPTGGPLVTLPFFGREASFPTGAAALARASGAPIVPAFVILDERTLRYRSIIEEPIVVPRTRSRDADLRAGTAALVSTIERTVRRWPEQWYNFYPYWDLPAPEDRAGPFRSAWGS